ncbi:class II histone deacetylase [Sphaerisporangium fuscum]|uniref:class II histone deacetylase n=1 Tax=Sphaerisporangium fuscum TaxID=2835868 RepID=UPI001BDD5969|nr:class II histone deacetylase [Sphaerisporangium fuscum]
MSSTRTGLVWDERCMWHDSGTSTAAIPGGLGIGVVQPEPFIDGPEPKRRFHNLLQVSGLAAHLRAIPSRPATEGEVLRWHDPDYVKLVREASAGRGGEVGELTPVGPGSYDFALVSAGSCLVAVEAVLDGVVRNAFALVRPPGHHAERDQGRGFCVFGNIVLAVLHVRATRGIRRVAVVDWDVHHGNGTEHAFYGDPDVLTVSIHQDNLYPLFSGAMTDRGEGEGLGANLNIPLPPGSGTGAYLAAMDRVVLPLLRAFQPEMVFLAAGFDASAYDPIGRMLLGSESYRALARLLVDTVDELCEGRLVACQEGGYSSMYVPFCGLATIEEMSGVRTGVADPMTLLLDEIGGQELQPHQEAVIEAARQLIA